MQFLFKGFQQKLSVRRFQFESVAANHARTPFAVSADVTLFTKYNVHLQEGPMLCMQLLESAQGGNNPPQDMELTEKDILTHVKCLEAAKQAALLRRKPFARRSRPGGQAVAAAAAL